MRSILRRILTSRRTYIALAIVVAAALLWTAIRHDYGCDVTGFGACDPAIGDPRPEKTLWDWLDLLIVPAVLAVVGLVFTRLERANERAIADQRFQDETLRTYLDQMTELLLNKQLRSSQPNSEVRDVARVRTLIALRRLDEERRAIVMHFLRDSKLVGLKDEEKIVNFDGVDLSKADLTGIDLSTISLGKANLGKANLGRANLFHATLSEATLEGADLRGANLEGATLSEATLRDANLHKANLRESTLIRTNLEGADLREVNLSQADLSDAFLIRANLSDAFLIETNLTRAILIAGRLSQDTLSQADLTRTILEGVILEGASISKEQLATAKFFLGATVSSGQEYQPPEQPTPPSGSS